MQEKFSNTVKTFVTPFELTYWSWLSEKETFSDLERRLYINSNSMMIFAFFKYKYYFL